MSNMQHTSAHIPASSKISSTLRAPTPTHNSAEWVPQDRLGLTPEQSGVMDLLEGRVLRAPLPQQSRDQAASMQRDVALALTGGLCLMSGLVAVFFMAALGAVLLTIGALFCVAAYEHAVSVDSAAILAKSKADARADSDDEVDGAIDSSTLV